MLNPSECNLKEEIDKLTEVSFNMLNLHKIGRCNFYHFYQIYLFMYLYRLIHVSTNLSKRGGAIFLMQSVVTDSICFTIPLNTVSKQLQLQLFLDTLGFPGTQIHMWKMPATSIQSNLHLPHK